MGEIKGGLWPSPYGVKVAVVGQGRGEEGRQEEENGGGGGAGGEK